ncbi:MAG: NADP-dependent glyceraldehyde-3-phosphate dehydrogenase [Bacteroidetes bacterium]|nr:NADP-dependent glyceraldehyde-3-phosphate dehydrogenase [Bacteroidota bacterium]
MQTIKDHFFPGLNDIPEEFRISEPFEQKEYLIGGKILTWAGDYQEVLSPVCLQEGENVIQQILGHYPLLSEREAEMALEAACKAYDNGKGEWPVMSVQQRITHMEDFTLRMQQKKNEVVKLLMWEIGKSLSDSVKEFDRTIEYIRDTIDALKQLDRNSSRFQIEQGVIGQIRRAPLGVVLCMGPYNYPLNETFTTLIPALIMGNTVIFKPPKYGVLLHRPLMEAFRDSFPPGVVNMVYGDGQTIISPMMQSGRIDVLAFIGSSRVANILKKQHPRPNRLRSVLGLEAKNAAIVLPDADIDLAVKECLLGSLSYNGQRCTALKMLFIHEDIRDVFINKFTHELESLKTGMPWETGVMITPLPSLDIVDYMKTLVNDATNLGAHVVNPSGGKSEMTFFYPALLFPVNDKMKIFHEEQFGPVIPSLSFKDIQEPLEYIQKSNYGQQLSIFGTDPGNIASLIDPLVNQVCRLNINSQCQRGPDTFPFTGRKDSAEGTLSVSDALRVFSIRTLVAAKSTELNRDIITHIIRERESNFLSTDFIF